MWLEGAKKNMHHQHKYDCNSMENKNYGPTRVKRY